MANVLTTPRQNKSHDQPIKPADVNATGEVSATSWREEISGRVHYFTGTFEKFLDDLVPCSTPYNLTDDLTHAFDEYEPVVGHETASYDGLVRGLDSLHTRIAHQLGSAPA